jgi:hypothetical protein
VSDFQIYSLRICGAEVCGKQGTIGRNLTTSRHLVVSLFHILQYIYTFSFLYERYLSILYDSLIMYIVSYQIDSVIFVFVDFCFFADTSP